jgi:hypothetical protein
MAARSLLLLALFLMASCAPKRADVGTDLHRAPAGEILRELHARRAQLSVLGGKGELTFESPDRSGSAFFRFAMRRGDSLLVRLQGPFGMEVGSFLLTSSGFLFYNAFENSVLSGDPSNRRFRALLPFPMEQGELMDLFAGQLPLPHDTIGVTVARASDQLILFRQRTRPGEKDARYHVDAEERCVNRVEVLDSAGATLVDVEALDFRDVDGFLLPRRIRASANGGEESLAIFFTSRNVNGPAPSFQVTIPPSARRSSR